jgi:hypothetical protein
MGLPQSVFRNKEKRILRTALYTLGITLTEIALEGGDHITVEKNCPKRARHHTLLTGNTFVFVNLAISIFRNNGIGRTVFPALWLFALLTDNRHANDRVGVQNHHAYTTLLRIIDSKAVDGADHFTKLTSRAPLWNDR